MNRNYVLAALSACLSLGASAQFEPFQNDSETQVHIDLTQREGKKVPVEVVVALVDADSAIYQMPRMVPGTYSIYDFGRYLSDLVATNANGDTLEVKKLDKNRWYVPMGEDLYKISYWAEASEGHSGKPSIFGPAATVNDSSTYLLNLFGYAGYMKGDKELPIRLTVSKPDWMYGSTTLDRVSMDSISDQYKASDYFDFHDNPILYAKPDTATKKVAGIEIIVGVNSGGSITAQQIMDDISPIFEAAYTYLGDTLPAKKYGVLLHTTAMGGANNGFGALEHHTSTVVVFPDIPLEYLGSGMRDVVAHEFFHIVTPLNIHSEYISDFDFMKPEMSLHLWLYEGVTEYNSIISQRRGGLITEEAFFKQLQDKMEGADGYNENIPFTMLSKHALGVFESQYTNVYQQGALIGAALDLKLRSLSDGEYGLRNLLTDLGNRYGQDVAFPDDELFDIITEMTYPEMKKFFALHIESAQPLPWEELLPLVGVDYYEERTVEKLDMGKIALGLDQATNQLYFRGVDPGSQLVSELDVRRGDRLIEFDGIEVNVDNVQEVIEAYIENFEDGSKLKIVVMRENDKGDYKKKKLSGRMNKTEVTEKHVFILQENLTPEQQKLRKQWLN